DGGQPACPLDAGTCVEVSPTGSLGGACVDERWLAYIPGEDPSCPAVSGAKGGAWVEAQLFEEPSAVPAVPPALEGYCVYEWSPGSGDAGPDLNRLHAELDAQDAEYARDCYVVAPSGSSAGVDAGWRTLRDDYHLQTGRLPELPQGGNSAPARIRVAVVDSAPNGYAGGAPSEDRSGHGHAVGWIVREHACPGDAGTPCIGQIADRLALPQITLRRRDLADGGYFGSQGQVAKAVHGAVHAWRAFNLGGGNQQRLVVNLSLGWDPVHGGETNMPLPARAVYDAITHAVCQGALVVAAAGNDPGGPGIAAGPMLPGGWETRPGPTAAQCNATEGPSWSAAGKLPPADAGFYQPLIHAVSGVRADDSPLINARPGGRARMAAPAAHALAEDHGAPTDVLTGTSAAAAVTSAIAATVWGYRPKLTAPEVMDIIRRSGAPLGEYADFCLGGRPCPRSTPEREVVRANLCKAVRKACLSPLESCPAAPPACASRPPHAGTLPSLSAGELATMAAGAPRYDASAVRWSLAPLEICGFTELWTERPEYPAPPCPRRQYYGAPIRPWSAPQPSSSSCPVCTIEQNAVSGTYSVTLSIDEEFVDPLGEPVLRVNDSVDIDLSGIGMGTLSGGDVAVVENLDLSSLGTVESAEITFVMTDGGTQFSTESELIVQP
ncbi:MAG TPA: hypothetical protein VFB81_05810, partial [Myxococcales bacterium]|nr:hypothetical protein [Myxococcales bacterium]